VRTDIEDDDGGGAALVDHVHEGLLEIGPELPAPMRGPHAELVGERAIETERGDGGVAEIQLASLPELAARSPWYSAVHR
jgi:hypothetical protein